MWAQAKLYVLGGAAIAVLAGVSWLLWLLYGLSGDLSASEAARLELKASYDSVVEANKANAKTISDLQDAKKRDDTQLTELSDALAKVKESLATKSAERDEIEAKNPDVKTFLDTDIPSALRMPAKATASHN